MSNTRQNTATIVASKIEKMNDEIAGAANDEAKVEIYNRFLTFFAGVTTGLEAASASEEDAKSVTAASALINKKIDVIEAEFALSEAMA